MKRLLILVPFVVLATAGGTQARDGRGVSRAETGAIARTEARRYERQRAITEAPFASPFGTGQPSRPVPPSGSGSTVVPNR